MSCADAVTLATWIIVWFTLSTFSPTSFGLFSLVSRNYMHMVLARKGPIVDWIRYLRAQTGTYVLGELWVYFAFNLVIALLLAITGVAVFDSFYCFVLGTPVISVTRFYWMGILLAVSIFCYKLWYSYFLYGTMGSTVASCIFGLLAFASALAATILIGMAGKDTGWDMHYQVALGTGISATFLMLVLAVIITWYVAWLYHCHINTPVKSGSVVVYSSLLVYISTVFYSNMMTTQGQGHHVPRPTMYKARPQEKSY